MPDAVPDTVDVSALLSYLSKRYQDQSPKLIETHISWVLIAGEFAYKIKRPVKFAFVDFLSLDQRKYCCEEEVRLNRRFAPEIYLGVVPIIRVPSTGEWVIDPTVPPASNEIVEWAVKMRAFQADTTLDRATTIDAAQIDAIADRLALFHQNEPPISAESPLGSAAQVAKIAQENLAELSNIRPNDEAIQALQQWTAQEVERLSPVFTARKQQGAIKDGHGDLHLGNIAIVDGEPLIFDCIEFSDTLRCIDVINEIAFLFMDLCARGHTPLAWRMLNRWLEHSGDYAGLKALPFYVVYRALVRAKISLHQKNSTDFQRYLALAREFAAPTTPALLLMHGFSGSGKTYASQRLVEAKGMIRLRSDVERKRLHGLSSMAGSRFGLNERLYHESSTQKTFDHLEQLAALLLQAGFGVIVDATFLRQSLRKQFIGLAERQQVAVTIVDMDVPPEICRERILNRQQHGRDASEATIDVLDRQLAAADPLTPKELAITIKTQ